MAEICGAKTRSGEKCKGRPMANGRCRMHGGKSTGAPKQNANAAKPGSIYSKFMTDEEAAIAASLELGSIDEELRLTRIRLMRALDAETDTPELEEIIEREGAENVTAHSEKKYKRRDYAGMIDRMTARVESLESRRLDLILKQQQIDEGAGGSDGSHDVVGFEVAPYDD